ncbi:MobF family relaxase [Streptomyces sp. NPDC051130]|uniref:MobF family relaxase n=1 Tax=Streptomyces sp. NPDC051130 TaxID=3157223 RepID=UPI0034391EC1
MGYATPIYASEQVEYRLAEDCGCDRFEDAQVEKRLAGESSLRWIGGGLGELGLVAGDPVDPDAARMLMDGRDWRTGERLVERKKVLDPRGKLAARVVVDAVRAAADESGMTVPAYLARPALSERFARAERGILRDGEAHLLPFADAERLAVAAGLGLDGLYGAHVVAMARPWMRHHVDVGLRGVDITLDLPKSVSAVYGLAGTALAARIEEDWLASVTEAVDALEGWAAYGMAGHHGDGRQAERVETSGLIGWTTLHRSARPVDGSPGDPHLHVHVNIAHMAKGADGKWRTIAGGGEDLHRYAHLVNEIAEGRLRARLIEGYGARFDRSPTTGSWELTGVDAGLREAFSRRHRQVIDLAGEGASRERQKTAARKTAESKEEAGPDAPRHAWRTRATALLGSGEAVDAMVAAALPGPDGAAPPLSAGGGPRLSGPEEIAARIWDAEHGLTASRKTVQHTHVLASVARTLPYLRSVRQLTALTDEALAVDGHAVRLGDSNRGHHTHRRRYTHTSVVAAEQDVIDCASAGLDRGLARLTVEAAEMTLASVEAAHSTAEQPFDFSPEQRAVITRLLTAGHAVDAVIGVAGAGKTTLMNAARTGWEAAGLRVTGASTAAVAAANLAAEAGIDSRTVAAWTHRISNGRGLHGIGVLVIDEAATVDDRALAALLRHAATTGTKVVTIGDPQQLRAVGIGGGFARVHEIVGGLQLTENRRQRDLIERAALRDWRTGARTTALAAFAAHGRVHAEDTATDTLACLLAAWEDRRGRWAADPHGQLAGLLLLAARRSDVADLNAGARAALVAAGELAQGRTYAIAGGDRIQLAEGDLVHIRRNDYRSRRDPAAVDVLNGFRGVVLALDERHGALIQWRRPRPSGGFALQEAWMSPRDIAEGRLTHAYAMTIASAQGLTADIALVYGPHADSHTLYPALSRAREESHLYLPLDELEDHPTRVTLGPVRSDAERLDRAVAAYGRLLQDDGDDFMVTDELRRIPAAREVLYTPWRQRPYGHIPTPHLAVHAASEDDAARRADQLAVGHDRRAKEQQDRLDAPLTPGRALAEGAHALLAQITPLADRAHRETQRRLAAERHAGSTGRIRDLIAESGQKSRLALRLAGTSREETLALMAQYEEQHAAAKNEAQRASSAAATAVREAWQTFTAHPNASLLNPAGQASPPRDAEALHAFLAAVRERIPVLAARIDSSVGEDVQRLRDGADAQRAAAARHRASATQIRQEATFREDMRSTAPRQYARETEGRAAGLREPRPQPARAATPVPSPAAELPPGQRTRRP